MKAVTTRTPQQEQLDNLTLTMVKLYPVNLQFAFKRVASILSVTPSKVQVRWYYYLRHNHPDVMLLVTESCSFSNTKTMTSEKLDDLTEASI